MEHEAERPTLDVAPLDVVVLPCVVDPDEEVWELVLAVVMFLLSLPMFTGTKTKVINIVIAQMHLFCNREEILDKIYIGKIPVRPSKIFIPMARDIATAQLPYSYFVTP
jgi:hypothetical protein